MRKVRITLTFFALLFIIFLIINELKQIIDLDLGNYVLIFTGLIILWYTIETFLLRKEAQRNTLNSVKPILVVDKYFPGGALTIINLGNGPALNIESRISYFHETGGYTYLQEILQNTEASYYHISKKDQKNISISKDKFKEYYSGIYTNTGTGIGSSFAIILIYNDMFNNPYQTVVRVEVNKDVSNLPENCLFKQTLFDSYESGELVRFPKHIIMQ